MGLENNTAHRSVHNFRNFWNGVSLRQFSKVPNIFVSPTLTHRLAPPQIRNSELGKNWKVPCPFGTAPDVSNVSPMAAPPRGGFHAYVLRLACGAGTLAKITIDRLLLHRPLEFEPRNECARVLRSRGTFSGSTKAKVHNQLSFCYPDLPPGWTTSLSNSAEKVGA